MKRGKKVKWEYVPLLALQLLTSAASVGVAILLNALIDAAETSIITQDAGNLKNILLVSVLYGLCTGLLIFASGRYKAYFIRKSLLQMRNDLASGTLQTGIADFENTGSAPYVTAFNQNFSVIEENVLKNRISLTESVISIVLAVAVLIRMNPVIAVISIAAMEIPSLLPNLFTKALGRDTGAVMESTTAYNEKVSDLLGGFEVIKTYDAAGEMLTQFSSCAKRLERSRERLSSRMAELYGLTGFASIAVQFLVMGLAGLFAVKGYITIGSIVAVTQLTGQVISPAFELSAKIGELRSAKPVLETLCALSHPEAAEKNAILPVKNRVSLKNITFHYGDRAVLRDLSADFEKGKKYAVIGRSGSGKSTLLKLLAGYYPRFDGEICTDGAAALPDGVAMIQQNTFLFKDSIRNNITMWKPYPEPEIMEAAKRAGLTEFIAQQPQGLDTLVEENGGNFSGGECQRIAIARALLRGKDVLLMDEATSALDEQTANAVESSILSLDNVTCISVTHRLTSEIAKRYSAVYTMDEGRLHAAGEI